MVANDRYHIRVILFWALLLSDAYIQVRDEIEQLMDDDGDMAEMYLTEKKRRMELSFNGDQSLLGYRSVDGASISAPVSPVSSPPESRKLEKTLSIARSRHESMRSTESTTESIEELEMLLEAYFVVIDSTLNKLTSVNNVIYVNLFPVWLHHSLSTDISSFLVSVERVH